MADPVVEQTSTTTTKETTEESAAQVLSPTPPIVADDAIRKKLAQEAVFFDGIIALVILYLMFFQLNRVSKDALPFVTGLIGTIVGSRRNDVATVYQYLFGSSSGSTLKTAQGK